MAVIFVGGSTWTVPADWKNSNNTIEIIGSGGVGDSYGNNGYGGGGGAYAKVTNVSLTPGEVITLETASSITLGFGKTTFVGSISTTVLTVSSVTGTPIRVGMYIKGASDGTKVIALGTGTGGAGTYTINNSQNVASVTTGYLCGAGNGQSGFPNAGAGGSLVNSFGSTKFVGGGGSLYGGGGAAGTLGAGGNGDITDGTGGTANNGLVAGGVGLGSAGLTSTIWTSTLGVSAGSGSGGVNGDGNSISGGPGAIYGGGGGGDNNSSGGNGGYGIIVITYVSQQSNMYLLF